MVATKKSFSFENRSPERPFNRLTQEDEWVTKRIMDKTKGGREVQFYKMLDNEVKVLRNYFPRLLSYTESHDWLEYKMSLIPSPDISNEYLNSKLSVPRFLDLLKNLSTFFSNCPSLDLKQNASRDLYKRVYIDRLDERWKQFQQMSGFQQVLKYSPQNITEHYLSLRQELLSLVNQLQSTRAIASHGDLCFSNIFLWTPRDSSTEALQMVDPRGGSRFIELLLPWSYDFAKISQCVLGNYDGILADKTPAFTEQKNLFLNWVQRQGHSLKELRLIESCHFLSLLPLHADRAELQLKFIQASQQALKESLSEKV